MSKNLLSEGEIRKMMKFANLHPLSENFIDRLEEEEMFEAEEDEMDMEAGDEAGGEEADMDMGGDPEAGDEEDDMDMGDEEDDMDMGDDPEAGGDEGVEAEVQISEEDVETLRTARDVIDQILAGAGGEDDMDMEEPDLGDEEEMDMDEPEDEEGGEAPAGDEGEDDLEESIVQEVTRRVAKRLLKKR